MKAFKTIVVILALGFVLSAGPGWAQTAPPAKPPATPAAQKPAEPAPQPQPPVPFPEGAKIAYIDYQFVASTSDEGKAATGKIQELQKKKNDQLLALNKNLQAQQTKLQSGASVLNEQARAQLDREIEKLQRELQFAQQDATEDIEQLTQQLQGDFAQKIGPIVEAIANERGLHIVFAAPGNIAWANPGLDISDDVVKRLNVAKKK
jgi:Skp family chaperone for outer membrane proteins